MSGFYLLGDISASNSRMPYIPQAIGRFGIISHMQNKPLREILAANLRHFMRCGAVDTQVKLSKKAGVAQSTVARVLAGTVDTQINIVQAFADAVGVEVMDLLLERSDEEEKPLLDLKKLAMLPKTEQEKIKSFADFLFSQAATSSDVRRSAGASFDAAIKPSLDEKSRAKRVAQRPLSNDSLSIDPNEKSESKESRVRRTK